MFKKVLIAALLGSFAFSITGCPPKDGNNNGNGSSQNENAGGGTNENDNASGANENANGGTSGNENANTAPNQNENTGGTNENANTASNANENAANVNQNSDGIGTGSILGRFAGTLAGTSTQTLNGSQAGSFARSLSSSLQFEGAFVPLVLPIPNYSAADAQSLTNVLAGQSQTFNFSAGGQPLTMVATVREATYLATQAHVVVDLVYSSVSGVPTRNGTGVYTFDGVANAGGTLTVSINTSYAVRLANGSLIFDTTDVIQLTGTLPIQP